MKKTKLIKKTWIESSNGKWLITCMEDRRVILEHGKSLQERLYFPLDELESLEFSIKAILDYYEMGYDNENN